jgi:hypothetical protein
MNKKILSALILCPIIGYGAIDDLKEERMNILSELGLPLPDSGIKLVPRSHFNLSQDEIQQGLLEEQQMKDKGYIEENNPRPLELLHFKEHASLQYKQYANFLSDSSTHLRASSKDLKLGFNFKGLPRTIAPNTIGFVPQGGFHKEGWSGAVQFFEAKNIGICAYAQMNVAVSHTAIHIALEDAAYTINNKLTLTEVRGNEKTGFDYRVKWYDEKTFHELECANMIYSKDTLNNVIELASKADNFIS